jgi:signal transduction histidine kinase
MAALTIAYVASGRLGLQLGAVSGFATLVWPPTGIAILAMLAYSTRAWPLVALGALTVNLWAGAPWPAALGICAGNALEAVVALWVLQQLRFDRTLSRVRDVVALVVAAAGSATVAASAGVSSLWAAGLVSAQTFSPTWAAWWLGDVLGTVVVGSVLIVWLFEASPVARKPLEVAVLVLTLVGTTLYSLKAGYAYLVYPPLVWAALRFRQHGAATSIFIVGAIAIAGTAMGYGPFVQGGLSSSLVVLQSFMGLTAATALLLGTAIAERDVAVVARDDFLAVASHELRTPLTSLKLHVEMLRRGFLRGTEPLTVEKLGAKVADIEQQTERLAALVTEVLDVSRAVAGRFALVPVDMDLGEAASDAAKRMETAAQRAGCELQLQTESCAGRWDKMRVEQILNSLISNAIKFGPGKPVEVKVQAKPEAAVLSVRDHGIGIKPEDQARIFERFERAVSMRHFGGLGLGLWLVRQVVDASGGSISVKSEPGQGSEFTVVLPRRPLLA